MGDVSPPERCDWCHQPIAQRPGAGRPRRFCSQAHRQRAYEARRWADAHDVPADQSIVSATDLAVLGDRIYRLEAAVEDVRADLAASSGPAAYRSAFDHLMEAVEDLVGTAIEPVSR